jgi:hypothetical protein
MIVGNAGGGNIESGQHAAETVDWINDIPHMGVGAIIIA